MIAINFSGQFIIKPWQALDMYAPYGSVQIGSGVNKNKKPSNASVTITAVCAVVDSTLWI